MLIFPIAERVSGLPFAGIRKVFEKAAQLETKGEKVIHFEIGRPDFDTPAHIKDAAKHALEQGLVHYTPNTGILLLKRALAESILADKKVSYDPDGEIMITAGGQEALFLSLMSILEEKDEVLIPDPGYSQYISLVSLLGGVPRMVPLLEKENGMMDLEEAEKIISRQTRILIINSPHNPTGGVLTGEQLARLCAFAKKHSLIILSDEAYDKILYENREHISPAAIGGMDKQTVICGSLSKTYSMTGWRIGYLAAPRALIEAAIKVQQNVMLSVGSFSQYGALAAVSASQGCVEEMVLEFDRRRRAILRGIEKIPLLEVPLHPQGAFYVFVRFKLPGIDSLTLCNYLLEEAGVAVVPGSAFGKHGVDAFRISFAASYDDCCEGMERIKEALARFAG